MKGFRDCFSGFLIGATMSLPGVSGGTTAVALGCYGEILTRAAALKKKENRRFLLRMGLGGILGFFLLAGAVNALMQVLPLTGTILFCAAAGAGLWQMGKDAVKAGFSVNGALFFCLGFVSVMAIQRLPVIDGTASPLRMGMFGVLLAAGIILPGISTSHLLMVFGLYDEVAAISGIEDLLPLLPLAIGAVVGIFLLTKPLAKGLERFPEYSHFLLLGFGVGSLKALVEPCIQSPQIGYLTWFQIATGIILGSGAVLGILKLHKNKKENGPI